VPEVPRLGDRALTRLSSMFRVLGFLIGCEGTRNHAGPHKEASHGTRNRIDAARDR
jgi:hypothetical protein